MATVNNDWTLGIIEPLEIDNDDDEKTIVLYSSDSYNDSNNEDTISVIDISETDDNDLFEHDLFEDELLDNYDENIDF